MTEEPLTGGNNTAHVSRVGDTVRRSRTRRGADVADLLLFLEAVGYRHAPRFLGVDEQGREILSFILGETTNHPGQRAAGAYGAAGRMLRDLHDATASYPRLDGHECVAHGDPGPFNTICRDGLPVAFIDWDSSGPGRRIDDLGYLAWTWCVQMRGSVPLADQARHLREVRDGYGVVDGADLVAAMIRSQRMIETAESANGLDMSMSATRRAHAARAVEWASGTRSLLERNDRTFLAALE